MRSEEVRLLAEGLQPADALEADYRTQLLALVDTVEDPWRRDRYQPGHLTASAFLLHPSDPAIALVHHAKLDIWVQPGGHVESDDDNHEAAARREVAEECRIDRVETIGVIDLDIHVFPERGATPHHLHLDLRWAFRAVTSTLAAGDGTLAVRWVPLVEATGMDESIARPARKLLNL
ncbi:MAG: NUDIX hydrolase [Acidimicrobiia bacterium]